MTIWVKAKKDQAEKANGTKFGRDFRWGDGYPREYGVRCERFKMFFRQTNGRLLPDCERCREYEKKMNRESIT